MLQLITILNRCHRFPGFVYRQAGFSSDHKSIEIAVRPRKGSAAICSRCHQSAPGYDQLPERRFELIPLWGFFVFLLYAMRRVDCRPCGAVAPGNFFDNHNATAAVDAPHGVQKEDEKPPQGDELKAREWRRNV